MYPRFALKTTDIKYLCRAHRYNIYLKKTF